MKARTKLILSLGCLIGVFLMGTAGYMWLEGHGLLESAYQTVLVISTVGLGEVWHFGSAARIWTIAVATFGIAAVVVAFSSLQAFLTGGEIRRVLGRRRLETKVARLRGHYIICGYGRMGALVSESLAHRGVPVVIVDSNPERTALIEEKGWAYVLGDASDETVLQQAGVERARGLVAVLPRDSDNVYVTLSARGLRKEVYIVARAEQPASESKLRRAGANRVICPHVIGAARIANLLTRPNVVEFVDVAAEGVELEVDEVTIKPRSKLLGKTLRESRLREKAGVMVVAIKDPGGQTNFNPTADTVLKQDDTLILIGPSGTAASVANLT